MAKHNSTSESRSAKAKFPHYRHLKVRSGYYDYHLRSLRPYSPRPTPDAVPWILLKGYWLNRVGFTIGTKVRVQVKPGRIVLTPQSSPS